MKIEHGKIEHGKIEHGKIEHGKIEHGKIEHGGSKMRTSPSTLLPCCSLLVTLLAAGCSSDGTGGPAPDAGPGVDSVVPGTDASPVTNEAGVPIADQGTPVTDGAPPPPPADGAPPPPPPVTDADRCAQAPTVTLGSAGVTISGDTSSMTDEHGLECGATMGNKILAGPQAYYRLAGQAGNFYRVVLEPQFTGTLVLFTTDACTKQAIEADCTSGGKTGYGSRSVEAGQGQALYIEAPASGAFYAAVESTSAGKAGAFKLIVEPFTRPANVTCQSARQLTFAGNKATITGDTGPNISPAEFPSLYCDPQTMAGPQVYYSFQATAGTTYQIKLTANAGQFLFSYFWGASCEEDGISADCSSKGATGGIQAVPLYSGESRTTPFTAATSGLHHIAIGAGLAFNFGSFTLEVSY